MEIILKRFKILGNSYFQPLDAEGLLLSNKALLVPEACGALFLLRDNLKARGLDLVLNDCFRTMQEQRYLRETKGENAKVPGMSGHNWGVSVDVSLNDLLTQASREGIRFGVKDLRVEAEKVGWFQRSIESWHFDFAESVKFFDNFVQEQATWMSGNEEISKNLVKLNYDVSSLEQAMNKFRKDYFIPDGMLLTVPLFLASIDFKAED